MVNFLIVVSGYNCAPYVWPCLKSIHKQQYSFGSVRTVIINDGSTDETQTQIQQFPYLGAFQTVQYKENHGAAFCRHAAINSFGQSGDVVILVGLDDELLPGALNRIALEYGNGKWMTYGNWKNQHGHGLPEWFQLDFDEETHERREYRKVRYRSTAPNTFRIELFHKIPKEDFILDGKWLDTTTESEVMFSCLEMCGKDRIGIIREPIYLYNQNLPNGTQRRLGQKYKNDILARIKNRKPKPLLEDINSWIKK